MRILFFSHQAHFIYGGEICTMEFIRRLSERHKIFFASPLGAYRDRVRKMSGVRSFFVPSQEFGRRRGLSVFVFSWLGTVTSLLLGAARFRYQILHATSLKAMVYAWPIGILRICKVVWHHHNIMSRSTGNDFWLRLLALGARKVVVPSHATASALTAVGISAQKIEVIYNGFDLAQWKIKTSSDTKLRIGFIGEISSRKGADWLPEICEGLKGNNNWGLTVIGAGLSEPQFAKQVLEKLAIFGERVNILGRREDIKQLLSKLDVILVPSSEDPLPTVIIEAFLSGVAVLARPVGGIPEMMRSGVEGFLVESPSEMVANLLRLEADRNLLYSFSLAARKRAESQFDSTKAAEQLELVYAGI